MRADPYAVWLSEIMLQQTTVAAAGSYFLAFITRWPSVEHLAAAELDEVLTAWAGLGYYARARNLHACARVIVSEHAGRFPDRVDALMRLPGIGTYTAGAIAAIAFDRPEAAVDGNVERVVSRLYAVETALPAAKPALRRLAQGLVPMRRAGDHAQAMMDLGATICTPRQPRCMACPLTDACRARALGIAETLPKKAEKAARPVRFGIAYWTMNADGEILLRRRPLKGLLGGMMEVPSGPWMALARSDDRRILAEPPVETHWRLLPGVVRHVFTHFELELTIQAGRTDAGWAPTDGVWVPLDRLSDHALPSVMRKVVRHALAHG